MSFPETQVRTLVAPIKTFRASLLFKIALQSSVAVLQQGATATLIYGEGHPIQHVNAILSCFEGPLLQLCLCLFHFFLYLLDGLEIPNCLDV